MSFTNLQDLLSESAARDNNRRIICYSAGDTETPTSHEYRQLMQEAKKASWTLRKRLFPELTTGSAILLHFDSHWESIVWFWAVTLSGHVAVMSTTFPTSRSLRRLVSDFCEQDSFTPIVVDTLCHETATPCGSFRQSKCDETALMLLTSGSTGPAKAVCLSHRQLLASLAGKLSVVPLGKGSFLNWIRLDHVASLVEIHLQAMLAHADQVHVHSSDLLADPLQFMVLVDKHRVSRTFAPNSFLAKLRTALVHKEEDPTADWDMSCLRYLASGGEPNVTKTCDETSKLLVAYGAPSNVIVPGFGMTETCAGAIFNTIFGVCMPGCKLRITDPTTGFRLAAGKAGNMELCGPVVFKACYNNPEATMAAFTDDGWFKTGNRGFIDQKSGFLTLVGRVKETMIINGMKFSPYEVESLLDESEIPGLTPSFNCSDAISKVIMMATGSRANIIPLSRELLRQSALGKLSRSKLKSCYERGDYKVFEHLNVKILRSYRKRILCLPRDEFEHDLLATVVKSLGLSSEEFGMSTPIYEVGITSMEMIKLKRNIEEHFGGQKEIPMLTIITSSNVNELSKFLRESEMPCLNSPLVTLQDKGTKPPLWLIHPGAGEVLVFLNLAKFIKDRPVYALRARGFNKGERPFDDLGEVIRTYHATIKEKQPDGPYALAGYCYGAMLAFEVSKVLQQNSDEVKFLGSFNLPPHIKLRMRALDYRECLLHLAFFLDLMTESRSRELAEELKGQSREDIFEKVMSNANPARRAGLAFSDEYLKRWACLAYKLHGLAVNYDPSGTSPSMDIFYNTPLAIAAASKEEWLDEHLSKWSDFTRSKPEYYEVPGRHYTMLLPENVFEFQRILRGVLQARGL
ncbi:acetyl-CoA synthetase-like protein [Aspergillus californicus]